MVDREWFEAASTVSYTHMNFMLGHNNETNLEDQFARYDEGQQGVDFVCGDNGKSRSYAKLITTATFNWEFQSRSGAILTVVKMCSSLKHVHLMLCPLLEQPQIAR